MKSKGHRSSILPPSLDLLIMLALLVLAACNPTATTATSPISLQTPASSAFLIPPLTATATLTPGITSNPTVESPKIITPLNAAEVAQLARLGQGTVNGAPFYSTDGELLIIPTTLGIDLYEAATLIKVGSIPALSDGEVTLRSADPRLVALSPERDLLAANLYAFAFSPNGDIREENMQQIIYLWDIAEGTVVWKRPVGFKTILADLAFSPDGQSIAVGFATGDVQLWRLPIGEELYSFKGTELEFSPDGKMIATMSSDISDDQHINVYSTVDGELRGQWEGQRAIFSPDGLLAIERDGATRVMDIEKQIALQAFNGQFVAFSTDGQRLALLIQGRVRLYFVSDGTLLKTMEGNFERVHNMQFSPDGQTLAVLGEMPMCPNCLTAPQAAVWQLSDGTRVESGLQYPRSLTYAPHEGHLVIWLEESIQILDPQDASSMAVFEEYTTGVEGVAFSPDEQNVAANSGIPHLTTRLWKVDDGRLEKIVQDPANPGYGYSKVVFSPDGQILWAQGSFWRIEDGERFTRLESALDKEAPPYVPASVAFSPDGKVMVVGYLEGHLRLWDLGEEKLIHKLEGYQGEVVGLAFSADGETLAAVYGYPDFIIQLWKTPEGERSLSIKGAEWTHEFSQAVFSPDGQKLVTLAKYDGMDLGVVELWRIRDGNRLCQLDVMGLTSVAFSKDGEIMASGSYDHTVRLWQTADGALLNTLRGHGDYVTDLAFSPSGELLASSSMDGTVILWGVHGETVQDGIGK